MRQSSSCACIWAATLRSEFPAACHDVKLSVKSDYAARAVLWLSQHYQEGVARTVEEMASAQGIPPNYLVQILIELKSARIVKSLRGKSGGYLLARPPPTSPLATSSAAFTVRFSTPPA